jgi:serine/threonine protein phosphatase 1
MKKWVIPDLHGCSKTLKILVEEKIKPSKEDHLYFLGDYIDRGPNPKGVIDYIIDLEEKGFQVFSLKGNHEEYLLFAYEKEKELQKQFFLFRNKNNHFSEWMRHGGYDTMKSFGIRRIGEMPNQYMQWIQKLNNFIIVAPFVLVHAGFNFERKDPFEDTHSMLWIRGFNVIPEKINNLKLIHGHVPVSLDFIKKTVNDPHGKFIPLDNGCYLPGKSGMGNLTALELNSMQLLVQPNVEL